MYIIKTLVCMFIQNYVCICVHACVYVCMCVCYVYVCVCSPVGVRGYMVSYLFKNLTLLPVGGVLEG